MMAGSFLYSSPVMWFLRNSIFATYCLKAALRAAGQPHPGCQDAGSHKRYACHPLHASSHPVRAAPGMACTAKLTTGAWHAISPIT